MHVNASAFSIKHSIKKIKMRKQKMATIIKTSITFIETKDGFRATSIITGEVFGIGKTEEDAKNNLFEEFNKLSYENAAGELFNNPHNCKVTAKRFVFTEV